MLIWSNKWISSQLSNKTQENCKVTSRLMLLEFQRIPKIQSLRDSQLDLVEQRIKYYNQERRKVWKPHLCMALAVCLTCLQRGPSTSKCSPEYKWTLQGTHNGSRDQFQSSQPYIEAIYDTDFLELECGWGLMFFLSPLPLPQQVSFSPVQWKQIPHTDHVSQKNGPKHFKNQIVGKTVVKHSLLNVTGCQHLWTHNNWGSLHKIKMTNMPAWGRASWYPHPWLRSWWQLKVYYGGRVSFL